MVFISAKSSVDPTVSSLLPLTLSSVLSSANSVFHEEVGDTSHVIGNASVISDIDTGFTVATIVTTTVATTVTSSIVTGTVATTAMSPVIVETTAVTAVFAITLPVVSVDLGIGLGADPSSSISVLYTGLPVPTSIAPIATISVGDVGDDDDESDHNLEVSADDEVSDEADSVTDNPGTDDNTDAVDNPDVVDSSDDSEEFDEGVNAGVHDSDCEMNSFNPSPFVLRQRRMWKRG